MSHWFHVQNIGKKYEYIYSFHIILCSSCDNTSEHGLTEFSANEFKLRLATKIITVSDVNLMK